MSKQTKIMDFIEGMDSICPDASICSEKAEALADLLIPKTMYIPLDQVEQIKEKLSHFENIAQQNDENYPLLNLIHATLLYKQGQYETALSMLNNYKSKKDRLIRACYSTIKGTCYRSLGQKENALAALHVTTGYFYDNPSQVFASYIYHIALFQIADINAELGNYQTMLEQQERLLKLSQSSGNIDMVNRALNGIGRAYLELGDNENCLKYLQIAERSSSKEGSIRFLAKNQHDLGIVYFRMKKYSDALEYLKKALEIRENYKIGDAIISSHILIGKVYLEQDFFDRAIESLNKAESIAEELKINRKLRKIYKLLSEAYEKSNKFDLSLSYFKKFHTVNDNLNDVKSTQRENEKVREINTKLKQQKNIIGEQKAKIEAYASRLVATNMQLQNFASIAAHDLKAPIRITNNFVGLLTRKHKNTWDDADKEYIDFITKNMKSLSTMIDDLLSLSKLDQDLPPMKSINTHTLIEEVLNRLQSKIKDIKPEILIQDNLPNVVGHASLVGQLFQNLIDNTLKYRSKAIPKIQISCGPSQEFDEQKYITFEIKDNGLGIPDYLQEKVFELFSGTNGENSNGIGLATCKKIISNYGGNIWVKSEEGIGTSVFFTLLSSPTS
jgi:signal transduction histidine kinase